MMDKYERMERILAELRDDLDGQTMSIRDDRKAQKYLDQLRKVISNIEFLRGQK